MGSMARNSLGREVPTEVWGMKFNAFKGAYASKPRAGFQKAAPLKCVLPGENKVLPSLEESIKKCGIEDGDTLSFHHHFRSGDFVLNKVFDEIAKLGIKDIELSPSSLHPIHKQVIPYIEQGIITRISGSTNGPIGEAVSCGVLADPVILRSHGGRARAIMDGELSIDAAFLAATAADEYGNMNGTSGPNACGALGYAMMDARYAKNVVAVTDNLVKYPLTPISIPQTNVDYVVKIDCIGNPEGIVSTTTKITTDPLRLRIAKQTAQLIEASGLMKDGLSLQTGAGGISLAATYYVANIMRQKKIVGSFGSGGITGYFVEMLKEGLLKNLFDVQCFDLIAAKSIGENRNHIEISAEFYASPHTKGCIVNMLDVGILGATEVDTDFNVNVATEADGRLLHGIGGHQDVAAGAKLSIVTLPLIRGRLPSVVDRVMTVTTPGETIDAIITERGIAINPMNHELLETVMKNNPHLHLCTIEELNEKCKRLVGMPEPIEFHDKIIGVVEYRDGTLLDVVWQPKLPK